MRKSIVFFVLILCISQNGFAERLLIGIEFDGAYFHTTKTKERRDNDITLCDHGFSEFPDSEKSGDFAKDECGGKDRINHTITKPNIMYETSPFYFFETNFGATIFLNPAKSREVKLIDFPKFGQTSKVKYTARFIGIPIFYTWGNKDFGNDGDFSIRLGGGRAITYFDPIEINSGGKRAVKTITTNGDSFIFSIDWGYFSYLVQLVNTKYIEFKEFENDNNKPVKLNVVHQSQNFNYVWYF